MPPKNSRKYTDLQLACAVAESKTMREVLGEKAFEQREPMLAAALAVDGGLAQGLGH